MTDSTTTAQRNRLGRGLASLMSDLEAPAQAPDGLGAHRLAPVDSLHPGPFNPRRDFNEGELDQLAASIREKGLVQPLLVRPRAGRPGFEIVAGERRWRAAQRAGVHQVPVIVRELDDRQALELAIVENVQRTDLNAIEEAQGYRQLMDLFGHTQEALATVLGKSRSHLANMLRLLRLPEPVQAMVRDGALTAGHARALVGRPDAQSLADDIVRKGLTVREVEALMQQGAPGAGARVRRGRDSADARAAASELGEVLGLKVVVAAGKGESGELRIRYRTLEQFEDLRRRLLRFN